jgi:hypothetical protein
MTICPQCKEHHSLSQCPRWRVRSAWIAAVLAVSGCASAPAPKGDDGSRTVTVPAERVQACREGGGCAIMSKAELDELVQLAAAVGKAQADSGLDSNGCRKGAL